MADRVAGIHDKFNGDLDVKIAEIHDLIQSMSTIDDSPHLRHPSKDRSASPGEFWSHGLRKRNPNTDSISTYSSSLVDVDKYDFPQTPGRTPELPGTKVSPPPLTPRVERDMERRRAASPVQPPPRRRPVNEGLPIYGNTWRNRPPGENDTPTTEQHGIPQPNLRDTAELAAEMSRPAASCASPVHSLDMSPSNHSYFSPVPSLVMSPSTASYTTPAASAGTSPTETPLIPPRSSHRPPPSALYATPRTSVGSTHQALSYTSEQSQKKPQPNIVPSELSMRISQNSAFYQPSIPSVELPSRLPSMLPSPIIPPLPEAQPLHSNSVVSSFMPVQDLAKEDPARATATDLEQAFFERELAHDSASLCEA